MGIPMKVSVLGSGVIGVSTAYYLARAGHEVTVIERCSGAALETSYANAGEISPGYAAPWAAPGIPLKAVKWMFMKHRPLIIQPVLEFKRWRWLAKFLRNCTAERYRINKSRMLRLAEYSRDCLHELHSSTGISYDHRKLGTLQLFRTQHQLDNITKDIEVLRHFDVPFKVLDREGVIRHEPALSHVREKYAGALHFPGDETGDCFKFTQALVEKAEALGVQFHYDKTVLGILNSGDHINAIMTDSGEMKADAYVMALGSYSPILLKPLGIDLPVCPVKGYSLTLPVTQDEFAPQSTVMDETFKVAVTRLGDRIRLGGTAELSGFNLELPTGRIDTLKHVVNDLFPEGVDMNNASLWAGLRPMTPDGTPVLGKTGYKNLFLNTGHGTLGWTMAAGSGRLIADIISGISPEISMTGLTLDRYQ